MHIDSHNKFKRQWDIGLIAELKIANSIFGKSILGQQISYFDRWDDAFDGDNHTAIPDEKQFSDLGKSFSFDDFPISVNGKILDKPNNIMIKEKFFNANSIFAYSNYAREVTQPPNHTINYEQQIMALRTFTAGYNMISPIYSYNSCFNFWTNSSEADSFVRHTRANDPFWKDLFFKADLQSREDYLSVLKNNIIDSEIGMYSKRSLEEYIDFVGYDPITLKLTRPAKMLEEKGFSFVSDEEYEDVLSELVKFQ
jgi:hypothetical protein